MRKKKKFPGLLFAVLLVLAGILLMSYPLISNYFAERNQARVIDTYQKSFEEKDEEDLSEEWELAEQYNENLSGDPVRDPFVPGSGYALPSNYTEVLNTAGDGVMGFLEIPKIKLRLPIGHGTSDEVLEKQVGHIESTTLPIGGESRHSVLTGHRGLPSAELFTRLDELEPGDQFYIHVLNEVLAYEVDNITVVAPTELKELAVIPGEDLVTVLTCTPYGINTHRLLVRGTRTEYIPEEMEYQHTRTVEFSGLDKVRLAEGLYMGLYFFLLILIPVLILRKRKKHEKK